MYEPVRRRTLMGAGQVWIAGIAGRQSIALSLMHKCMQHH